VLIIGRRGHVEVDGITEDLEHFDVIESPEEVRSYPSPRLGIVCQSTSVERRVASIRALVALRTRMRRSSSSTRSACPPRSTSGHSSGCSIESRRSWSWVASTRTIRAS
jgi:4-hydroxy-3-methylbut-2-enyl diphosphate reductase IspH